MLNNNMTVIKRLSKRSILASRKRNFIAILAIILTTFMIGTVFSVGISSYKNGNIMTERVNGTRANISVADIPIDKVDLIRELAGVKDVGMIINAGTWQDETRKDIETSLYALDDQGWEKLMAPAYHNIVGAYPTGEYELMGSRAALENWGIDEPQIGQQLTLTYRSKGEELTDTFTLSGFFDTYIPVKGLGIGYLSESYVRTHGLTLENDGSVLVRAADSRKDDLYREIMGLAKSGASSENEAPIGYNESSAKLARIVVIVMLVLFVVLSGFLLIYNILYISVTRDIHFYGRLKTIGATSKQLRKLVYRQAGHFMLWGISIGVALSILAAFVLLPSVMARVTDSGNTAMPTDVSFSPIIYLGTIMFSAFTVLISCRKPAKLAGKVSPVEAVRYTGVETVSGKNRKHSVNGGKPSKMAFRNVFRDKKRAILVFASLFMGILTLLASNCFLGSLKVENYINRYYPWDFRYESIPPLSEEHLNEEFQEKIRSFDGITKMEVIRTTLCELTLDETVLEPFLLAEYDRYADEIGVSYEQFMESLRLSAAEKEYCAWFFSIPDDYLVIFAEKYKETVDIEAFRQGEICILGYGDYPEMVGKSLYYTAKENGVSGSIKIGGAFRDYSDCSAGGFAHMTGSPSAIYVSDAFMSRLNAHAPVGRVQFKVKQEEEENIRLILERINNSLPKDTFLFTTKHQVAEEFTSTIQLFKVISGGFSLGFIFIGIINFFNVMATGIFARRRELAMIESVGMTKKQVSKMLIGEGAIYALITSLLVLTIGSGVIGILAKLTPMIADYAKVEYPVVAVAGIIAVMFVICMSVPPLVYRSISKESVTERLRAVE